jgi:hypothetical protein
MSGEYLTIHGFRRVAEQVLKGDETISFQGLAGV